MPHAAYLVTAVTSGRVRVFDNFDRGCIAARALSTALAESDAELLAWVLMPDHMHLLLQLGERESLAKAVQRIKGRIAFELARTVGLREVWQSGYHDHALRAEESIAGVARYLVANPLRAGLVASVGEWPFWDCAWLDAALDEPAQPTVGRAFRPDPNYRRG